MRLALNQRRAAKAANAQCEGFKPDRLNRHIGGGGGRIVRGHVGEDHDTRVVETAPTSVLEQRVERGRLRERSHAKDQRQFGFFEHLCAGSEALLERQAADGHGVDTTRSFRLPGGEPHQPAVKPALLGWGAGVQAGVFDARQQGRIESRIPLAVTHPQAAAVAGAPNRADISLANSTNATAPFEVGSNTTPGNP